MADQGLGGPKFVYSALRNKNWINYDGSIHENAFRRRPPTNPNPDTEGLSVTYTYEAAARLFGKGVIRISIAKLEEIGLRVEGSLEEDHANICGVPFDEPDSSPENRSQVIQYARAIIGCCEPDGLLGSN